MDEADWTGQRRVNVESEKAAARAGCGMPGVGRLRAIRGVAAALLVLIAAPGAHAAGPPWPDTPMARLEALAVLQGFNADLLSHPSATLTLERWCAAHRLVPEGRIVAELDRTVEKPATAEQRAHLRVSADELVAYRRVRLSCGGRVLSEADNWYVPGRLTPEMNRLLDETTTLFGRAVLDLGFRRELLGAGLLWHPLLDGWEMQPGLPAAGHGALAIPDQVLEHRAVLLTRENVPFSEVREIYTADVLGFAPPQPSRIGYRPDLDLREGRLSQVDGGTAVCWIADDEAPPRCEAALPA